MKKIIILFTVLLLTGCGVGNTRNSKNNSQHHNIYMNTDSKCAGIKRVSKKYKETNPKDMLEKVDYCFIGKIKNFKDVEIYENGKIKTLMSISIESTIKGDVTGDIEIYRDGGRSGINEYVNYPKDTCLDKNKLKSIPDKMKESCYIEVVPDAYFQAKEGEEYMFFVKNKKQMEIYNDAYGRLKVLDDKNLENVYTNKKYKISEIS